MDGWKKKSGAEAPLVLCKMNSVINLPIDIVGISEMQKCELKYVIFTQSRNPTKLYAQSDCSEWLCGGLYPCRTSARNHSDMAKSQPISIANQCGRSIIDREKSKPSFSI